MNGEIWWVDFQEPRGSTPAFVRPGIIVQNNELNESDLNSTIVIPITTNCRLADYKGNVFLDLCAQITTVDKQALLEKKSKLSSDLLNEIYEEISWVLEN